MSKSSQLLDRLAEVRHCDETPNFAKHQRRLSGAKGQGVRYERLVQRHFGEELGAAYLPGPWFLYRLAYSQEWNYTQPDGVYFDFNRGTVVIYEVKYSHCAEAYFQLLDRYLPLLKCWLKADDIWNFAVVEVVRWYDRLVQFPTQVQLCKDPFKPAIGKFNVHIWKP